MTDNRMLSSDLHMGSPMYSSNGEKIGRLRFTISDPEAPYAVRQLVIEKGMLLHRDVTIPIEAVKASEKSGLILSLSSDELQEMPEFVEGRWFQGGHREYRDHDRGPGPDRGPGGPGGGGGGGKRGRRSGRRGHH